MAMRDEAADGPVNGALAALFAQRAPSATVCPSEVARRLSDDWRAHMPRVHAAIDALVAAGAVRLSWRGAALAERAGPYRIARVD